MRENYKLYPWYLSANVQQLAQLFKIGFYDIAIIINTFNSLQWISRKLLMY